MDMGGAWQESYAEFCERFLESCQCKGLDQVLTERLQALTDLERHPGKRIIKKALESRIAQPWLSVYPACIPDELLKLFDEIRIPAVLVEGRFQA